MLLNTKIETNSMLKEVKPHLYSPMPKELSLMIMFDFTEQEVLEMSPEPVWRVFKVPKSKMIILTFLNVPNY